MANEFKRGLPQGALEHLEKNCGWWRDVVSYTYEERGTGIRRPLLFALRDGYFNLYAEGQSVLKVGFDARRNGDLRVSCKLHRKYVEEQAQGQGYLDFDGKVVTQRRERRHVANYDGPATLERWVKAARHYSGKEKMGAAVIANEHPEVIDVEMALPANDPASLKEKKVANRMDIVALERHGEGVRLAFYEAKLFSNGELRSKTFQPRVLGRQLENYRTYVSAPDRRQEVLAAYENACSIAVKVDSMFGRQTHSLVQAVAKGARLDLDPQPRLVIFDYGDNQIGDGTAWHPHEQVLRKAVSLTMGKTAAAVRLGAP